MTGTQTQQALEVNLPEGTPAVVTRGNLCVAFSATGASLTINGQEYSLNDGIIVPTNVANDQQTSSSNLVQRAYEVGQRLRDGTVVLSVDLDKNQALFVPAKIFGGEAKFDDQNNVVESVNRDALHGHKDWRRITDDEGKTLAYNWGKVAPAEWQGRSAPWFWLASPYSNTLGRVRRGGEVGWYGGDRGGSGPVPVVRSGLARSLDI